MKGHYKRKTIKWFAISFLASGFLVYCGLMYRKLSSQPDPSVPMAEAAVKDAMAEMEEDIRNRADMQKEIDLFIKITARKEKGAVMQHENTSFNADIDAKTQALTDERNAKNTAHADAMESLTKEIEDLESQSAIAKQKTTHATRAFLRAKKSPLAFFADEIVTLPNWRKALAIIGQETAVCTTGIARSTLNCSGIEATFCNNPHRDKSLPCKSSGRWVAYDNALDSFKDTVTLVNTTYRDKSIAFMSKTYCVNESGSGVDGCPEWAVGVSTYLVQLSL